LVTGARTSPLRGRTIVVTRAPEQSPGLIERLTGLGATVVEVPTISIVDADDGGRALAYALDRLTSFDWLVVTSANGAMRVASALRGAHQSGMRVAAVGTATRDALGRAADLVPQISSGAGLVAEFPPGSGRVLLVQGDQASDLVSDGIRAKGWQVERVVAYRTVSSSVPAELAAAARHADAVTFTSGTTARGFVEAVGLDCVPPVAVSIGPVTTAAAVSLGIHIARTADPHTIDGLVAAVCEALSG
jgi:uroporphyrinogen-III synthase